MNNSLLQKWAALLVGYSIDVQPGESVSIMGEIVAEELVSACAFEVIDRGGYPIVWLFPRDYSAYFINHSNDDQLTWISPLERQLFETDASINIVAGANTRGGEGIDPARRQLQMSARAELEEDFYQRAADGLTKWTATIYPTNAYAQEANMNTSDFAEFVARALKLDQPDPVSAWQSIQTDQQRLIDWLQGKSNIHVVTPETDLTLSVSGRTWINDAGHENLPGGEVFTGPVETSANGHIRFSFPVIEDGRQIDDIRLRFEDGKVVDAHANTNEAYLHSLLDTDDGARFLGEFAFGTNFDIQRFVGNTMFDEKIGGTLHMALGGGYPETGSTNVSVVHTDIILDLRAGGQVTIDGELFNEAGRILV